MTAASNNGAPAPAASRQEVADVLEERLIDAEYKIWKKNTPFLYDFVLTHALEWPSLTCQFLPTVRKAGDTAEELSLLLGTHTTGEQNYLMMASCVIPTPEDVVQSNATGNADGTTATAAQYDEEKNEMGGFGRNPNSLVGKIEVKMKVKHEGEVNRARHMPQNHFVVATRGPSPEVYVFDMSKHPSFPTDSAPFAPQGVCVGHAQEGYGLCWSPHQQGYLLSGSEDKNLCLWNVETVIGKGVASNQPGTQIPAMATFSGHSDVVEDVITKIPIWSEVLGMTRPYDCGIFESHHRQKPKFTSYRTLMKTTLIASPLTLLRNSCWPRVVQIRRLPFGI
jgi:histone-binding protein RBBP4